MRSAAAGLLSLCAAYDVLYSLDNRVEDVQNWIYGIEYLPTTQKNGCGEIEIAFHPDESVRSHQCYLKCHDDPKKPGCEGYDWSDQAGTNTVCLAGEQLEALCTSLEECVAIKLSGGPKGVLIKKLCDGGGFGTFAVKTQSQTPSCPMGVGVQLSSPRYRDMEGLYVEMRPLHENGQDELYRLDQETLWTNGYEQVEGISGPPMRPGRIVWHTESGCGWSIERDATVVPAPPPAPDDCKDDHAALNAAFGQAGDDVVPEMCEVAGVALTPIGQVGQPLALREYCANVMFAAMCPGTCMVPGPCKDDEAALAEFLAMTGEDPATCSSAGLCDDPVVAALCRVTCAEPDRRLAQSSRVVGAFRRLMARAIKRGTARRLDGHGQVWEQVYLSWDDSSARGDKCGKSPSGATADLEQPLWGVQEWGEPSPATVVTDCPAQPKFDLVQHKFCPRGNIALKYSGVPELVDNQCFAKCTHKPSPFRNNVDEDGYNDWCSGNSNELTAHSNALCLPREDCERLCLEHPDCHSIDIHRKFSRCYLNTYHSCADATYETNKTWDVLEKTTTGSDPTAPANARDIFVTYSGRMALAGQVDTETGKTRAECEQECLGRPTCTGFIFRSKCELIQPDPISFKNKYVSENDCDSTGISCIYLDAKAISSEGDVDHPRDDSARVVTQPNLTEYLSQFLEADGAVAQYDTSVVWKIPAEGCHAVLGMAGDASGKYYKESEGVYVMDRNAYRIIFVRANSPAKTAGFNGDPDAYECDGWIAQKNDVELYQLLYNCTDAPDAANLYLTITNLTDSPKDFPCEWGYDSGMCQDIVFAGLCAWSCTPVRPVDITTKEQYKDQSRLMSEDTVTRNTGGAFTSRSYCHRDNHKAAAAFATTWPILPTQADKDPVGMCEVLAGFAPWNNVTHAICSGTDVEYPTVFRALCKQTCRSATVAPTPAPDAAAERPDEADSEGAVYPDRRLAGWGPTGLGIWPHPGLLVKWPAPNAFVVKYEATGMLRTVSVEEMPTVFTGRLEIGETVVDKNSGDQATIEGIPPSDADYSPILRTWQLQRFDPDRPCPQTASAIISVDQYQTLIPPLYGWSMSVDPGAKGTTVCEHFEHCPPLTTCILNEVRLTLELAKWRAPGLAARAQLISELPVGGPEYLGHDAWTSLSRKAVLDIFQPRTLVGPTRAEAYVVPEKFEFAGDVYRSVLGATIVRLRSPVTTAAQFGEQTIVTLAPDSHAPAELGRTYELLDAVLGGPSMYFTDFVTDVIRIERFGKGYEVLYNGTFAFELYAPGAQALTLFAFDRTTMTLGGEEERAARKWHYLTDIGGTVEPKNAAPGWYIVTVPTVEYDIVGADDVDECATPDRCGPDAHCANQLGGEPVCTCHVGFEMKDGICVMAPYAYDPSEQHYYLRLRHADRLDYGWRVKEISMYPRYNEATGQCAGPKFSHSAVGLDLPGRMGMVDTGPDPSYPAAGKGNENLLDGRTNTEWWSALLNLNPEEVDETRGGAQAILWAVRGSADVACVAIEQVEGHHSTAMVLERGPLLIPGVCGMAPEPLCPITRSWTASPHAGESKATFATACGEPNTQYFGELLALPGKAGSGWYGNYGQDYAVPVPSACHCEELCVSLIPHGCRSYRYFEQASIQHCYLQSNLVSKGSGYWGQKQTPGASTGWSSGTPGLRVLDFSPTAVVPGEPFSLKLTGVGFPFDEDPAQNLGPRQRVKLVPTDAPCTAPIPVEVSGIGCTKTKQKIPTGAGIREKVVHVVCNPRPVETALESAVFGPLTIAEGAVAAEYKVCYCAGACHSPANWAVVTNKTISVSENTFMWTQTTPEAKEIPRKTAANGRVPVEVSVERPPFGSYSDARGWELRVVRDHFGCGTITDAKKWACADVDKPSGPAPTAKEAPAGAELSSDGTAVVSFDAPVTTAGCTGDFTLVDTADDSVISTRPCASALVNGYDVYLMALAAGPGDMHAGKNVMVAWDDGAVAGAAAGSVGPFAVTAYGSGDVTVLGTSLENAQSPDGNIEIYFSHVMSGAVNVTVLDCGFSVCTAGALAEITHATTPMSPSSDSFIWLSVEHAGAVYGKRYRLVVTAGLLTRASGGVGPAETFSVDFSVGCSKPGLLPTPDSAVWRFHLKTELAEIGNYLLCFRQSPAEEFVPIPSVEGATSLTVVAIAADRAHPRGIFHNQKFSVLAGSGLPRHLKVLGTGLPYPADSRLLLNAHPSGVCGDRSQYTSVDLTYASPDTAAPKAKYVEFFPEPTGASVSVSTSQQILLAFSEAVVQAPCVDVNTSYISLVSIGNAPTQKVLCHNTVVMHNKVVVSLTRSQVLAASQYYVRVETGGLTDPSGNQLTILQTLDTYIVDTTSDTTPPTVIASFPCSGCEESLEFEHNSTKRNNTVMLYLSEDSVGVAGKLLRLFDCLGDLVCDPATDVEIATIDLGSSWQVHFGYAVLYVYFGPLESARRYRLTLEADALGEVGGGALVGPEGMFEMEFIKGEGGFDFRKHSVAPAADLSNNGLYTFPLQIPAATDVGTYTVCYCHDQDDTKLQDVGDADTRFLLFDDVQVA
ncbi:MAG: hypothetical protein CML60_05335, partial [Rhodobacteraceae bacterium]|nr:hypothetical protein [Paracoccaceae bacterium]